MKKIFTILLLLCSLCSVSYASEQEVVASFKNFTNQILTKIRTSYDKEEFAIFSRDVSLSYDKFPKIYWIKSGYCNLRSSIDIRKTDSLMTPYEGYLILGHDLVRYLTTNKSNGLYKLKQDAESSTIKKVIQDESEYKFVYAYQDGQWILKALFWKHPDVTKGFWKDVELREPLDMFIVRKTK